MFMKLSVGQVEVTMSVSALILEEEDNNTMPMSLEHASVNSYKVRKCVNKRAVKSMVHAFATNRLDYYSTLLYGLSDDLCVQRRLLLLLAFLLCPVNMFTPVMQLLIEWPYVLQKGSPSIIVSIPV